MPTMFCARCGVNPVFNLGGREYRLCATCAWKALQTAIDSVDDEVLPASYVCGVCGTAWGEDETRIDDLGLPGLVICGDVSCGGRCTRVG